MYIEGTLKSLNITLTQHFRYLTSAGMKIRDVCKWKISPVSRSEWEKILKVHVFNLLIMEQILTKAQNNVLYLTPHNWQRPLHQQISIELCSYLKLLQWRHMKGERNAFYLVCSHLCSVDCTAIMPMRTRVMRSESVALIWPHKYRSLGERGYKGAWLDSFFGARFDVGLGLNASIALPLWSTILVLAWHEA